MKNMDWPVLPAGMGRPLVNGAQYPNDAAILAVLQDIRAELRTLNHALQEVILPSSVPAKGGKR
jgi:hypothetical protein